MRFSLRFLTLLSTAFIAAACVNRVADPADLEQDERILHEKRGETGGEQYPPNPGNEHSGELSQDVDEPEGADDQPDMSVRLWSNGQHMPMSVGDECLVGGG